MKKAPVSEPDQPDLPAPPKNSAQPMSGSASVIGSEVIPNPLEERLAELRDLFRSARFNRMDELDVYAGDFRSFRDLGSIVTADMRHQMERQLRPADEPAAHGQQLPGSGEQIFSEGERVRVAEIAQFVLSHH